jgi:hypothetical protein
MTQSHSIALSSSLGLSKCNFSGGYAQLSVLQWGKNPYEDSIAVQSPLLRFSVTSNEMSNSTTEAPTTAPVSRKLLESVVFTLPNFPAYYVSLQFLAVQDFNFVASSILARLRHLHPTLLSQPVLYMMA